MKEKVPVLQCPICGALYKAKSKNGKRQQTCSRECNYKYLYKTGTIDYFATKNKCSVSDFIKLIDKEHNEEMRTIKEIAERYGIVRITLTRWCKKYGVRTRTISEDNHRRYAKMREEEKKAQTLKANNEIRELFKNPQWKEEQIKKVMAAQDMKPSKQEALFFEKILEKGYCPIRQYSDGLAGFVLDFAFPEIKLAIEIDGEYWHSLENVKKKDRRRSYFLEVKNNWQVIHIPARDFEKNPEHYIWEVIQAIECVSVA